MDKHRREISIEILVGLFMFTVLIALGVFTIVLSRDNFFKTSYQYEFVFSEVSGLREGDNVYLRGMNIGRVRQTSLEDDQVHIYVTLDVPIELRSGYKIEIVNASMLGGKYLKIYEGPLGADVMGENVTILGAPPVDVIEELSAAVQGIQDMIDGVNRGEGTLGKLLHDDAIYNNLVSVSDQLQAMGVRLENGEGTIGKLMKDEQVYNDLQQLMANLREVSDRLASGEGTLGKLVSGEDGVYGDLDAIMKAVRGITEQINSGEGTLGKLVRDDKLYDEVTLMVEDTRAAIDDLREASPITSFSSVLFGAF
ncbi:MAG: MCE family protein [Pontiellaceae bacterium]|nr:MCE family protein [Pontiellaceae bacterium]